MSYADDKQADLRSSEAQSDVTSTGEQRMDNLHILVCGEAGSGKTLLIAALAGDEKGGDSIWPLSAHPISFEGACRSFTSATRRYIAAEVESDAPSVRSIVAAGPACDVALLVTDARKGVDAEMHRHTCFLSLFGVRKLVLAINKIDLVEAAAERFNEISGEFLDFARELNFEEIICIPVSAKQGDNVQKTPSDQSWYRGPALREHLEKLDARQDPVAAPLRIKVDSAPAAESGVVAGRIVSGVLSRGDTLLVLPVGKKTRAKQIASDGANVSEARAGEGIAITLAENIDVSAGDMLTGDEMPPEVSDQIAAHVIWLDQEPMLPGRSYVIECNGQQASATIGTLKYKVHTDNLDHIAAPTLEQNEAGYCNLSTSQPLIFDPYRENHDTGGFILIDRVTKARVGVGMIDFGLRRATNISWQAVDIDKGARSDQKGQRPCVLWFTGLSGSGKSTVANLLEKRLHALGRHTYLLDGDNVRHGLNKDLGFTDADRVENIRRVAESAKLMVDAGLIVMAAFISPFRSERRMARDLFEDGEFIEIFVDTPLETCEDRDPKGLYKKARAGEIKNFTGIDSDYEPPERADIRLDAGGTSPEDLASELVNILEKSRFI